MTESLTQMKLVSGDVLQERMETIKPLKESEHEAYDVMKDQATGEHYLHYAYKHIDVAGGGEEELYHYLLPLNPDDVLAVIFEEQAYTYPDHWDRAFLRNGPDGSYVWFDPAETMGSEQDEAIGKMMADKLREFKQRDNVDEQSVRQFFDEIDNLFKDEEK